jgi:hypothetical protein
MSLTCQLRPIYYVILLNKSNIVMKRGFTLYVKAMFREEENERCKERRKSNLILA